MNALDIPESDWKIWRRLSQMALERFCSRVLAEASQFEQRSGSAHSRYLDLYRHLKKCDELIGLVFDDLKRSNAVFAIAAAVNRGLVSREEMSEFGPETQKRINAILEINSG